LRRRGPRGAGSAKLESRKRQRGTRCPSLTLPALELRGLPLTLRQGAVARRRQRRGAAGAAEAGADRRRQRDVRPARHAPAPVFFRLLVVPSFLVREQLLLGLLLVDRVIGEVRLVGVTNHPPTERRRPR